MGDIFTTQFINDFIWVLCWFIFFALFHSIAAHEKFKSLLSKIIGTFMVEHFWRLTYNIVSYISLYYFVMPPVNEYAFREYSFYQSYPLAAFILTLINLTGVVIVLWSLQQLNFFEFWGFKQAWNGFAKILRLNKLVIPYQPFGEERLEITGIYKLFRHPMLAGGLLIVITLPPTAFTFAYVILHFTYVFFGVYYEEKRLINNLGEKYKNYQKDVNAFFPKFSSFKNVKKEIVYK